METIQNAINGRKVTSRSSRIAPVYDPAAGDQTANLPLSTAEETAAAVTAAAEAAGNWAATPPLKRV
jgi:malonate-semialdehyde dehydrogenase (acetylating)/methylmalonate-semialdehyde dehydrogenase